MANENLINMNIGSISVITHRRAELLDRCLQSVSTAKSSRDINVTVLWQGASAEIEKVLLKNRSTIHEVIHLEKETSDIEMHINTNRYLAYRNAFSKSHIEWNLCLEEDVEISDDTIVFVEAIFDRFQGKRKFRGINLGSLIKFDNEKIHQFTKVRYGIHGPASVISRDTWMRIRATLNMCSDGARAWDGVIEPFLKTGFMVTPIVSRYIDNGFTGTHARYEIASEYFEGLQASWRRDLGRNPYGYVEVNIPPKWRQDAIGYSFTGALYASLRNLKSNLVFFNDYLRTWRKRA